MNIMEDGRIIKQYFLLGKQKILRVLNDYVILIMDNVNGSIILFDVNSV